MIKRLFKKFISIWRTPTQLGQKAVRSGAIVFFEKFIIKGMAFVRTVIIARLLLPGDIGLFGLAALAVSVNGVFFQPGFQQALIQEQGDVRKHMDSAWTANLILNVFLAMLLFFVTAPLSGWFFHNAQVVPLARVLALSMLIIGFNNIGITLIQKELRYNRQFVINIIGYGTQWTLTVVFALLFRNVWALVAGAIVGNLIFVILSYLFSEYRPHFNFDFSSARHLFRFGKWVGIAGILSFFISQGDNLTVGRMLNAQTLAFYLTAYSLGTLPATEIVGVIAGILFPLYANLQDDLARLKRAFVRIARLAFAISIPASFGLASLASESVRFVYGTRWLPMVPILYVILLYGLFKGFELITDPLFRGIGKPHVSTGVMAAQAAVMFVLIVPFIRWWGPVGAGIAVLAGFLVAQAIYIHQLRRTIPIGMKTLVEIAGLPMIAAAVMAGLILFAKIAVPVNTKLLLGAYIVSGVIVYALVLFVLDAIGGSHMRRTVLWVRQNI